MVKTGLAKKMSAFAAYMKKDDEPDSTDVVKEKNGNKSSLKQEISNGQPNTIKNGSPQISKNIQVAEKQSKQFKKKAGKSAVNGSKSKADVPLKLNKGNGSAVTKKKEKSSTDNIMKNIKSKVNVIKKQLSKSTQNLVVDQAKVEKNVALVSESSDDDDSVIFDDDDGDDTHQTLPPYMIDSRVQGFRAFQWLIHPYSVDKFMNEIFEKKPMLVKRKDRTYYKGVFSTREFDKIIRTENIQFGKNLDITSYTNDERKTHNADGRAYNAVVWDQYQSGCSVRFLNPQTYSKSVWKLNSILQEFFGSFVGANVYLTPPGTQGFAPHYDDIEAFIVQLEGSKNWKVYAPLTQDTTLPRYSSKNFSRQDLEGHKPLLTVELEPGDLLYFPRGWIHEASASDSKHSLHITLSTYQKNTFGDLMESIIPQALKTAIDCDLEFRQSLPIDYMSFMGVVNQDMDNPKRDEFMGKVANLMSRLINHVHVDTAVDQMAKKFIHDSLPPVLNPVEKKESIYGGGESWSEKKQSVVGSIEIEPDTAIKLLRYGMVRIVMEDEAVRLYHNAENSREYHEFEPQYIEVGAHLAPAVDFLLNQYPEYVKVDELPVETLEDKMDIANLLYDKGLVMVIQPDPECSAEDSSESMSDDN
ncbi:Bifunctional lysine-specific demethylase and histidyl-hydroxylase NO66 [Halotydeus destructor]|nr:Bifunctional lysine-specific demethylase and histidyl-hydroxylase NO66 [Halotydeus destructor]